LCVVLFMAGIQKIPIYGTGGAHRRLGDCANCAP